MRRPVSTILVLSALAAPAMAERAVPDAARAEGEAMAAMIDADGDGGITRGEIGDFESRVFEVIDRDGNGTIGRADLHGWEFGLADIAAFRGRAQAYDTAVAVIFDALDRDEDGSVTKVEHARGRRCRRPADPAGIRRKLPPSRRDARRAERRMTAPSSHDPGRALE